MQAGNVELIGIDTYRIGRLLRGQFGTDHVLGAIVSSGARVVYLGQGWYDIQVNADLRGTDINFSLTSNGRENSENFVLNYQADHLRPLSLVHIKTSRVADNIDISWVRRTRVGGDDWASFDVPLGEENERYAVDFLYGGAAVMTKEVDTPSLQIPLAELETIYASPIGEVTISVAQISQAYGRGIGQQFVLGI